jgi:splicing factor 3B subunit 2
MAHENGDVAYQTNSNGAAEEMKKSAAALKRAKKRQKKKLAKQALASPSASSSVQVAKTEKMDEDHAQDEEEEVVYVAEPLNDPLAAMFAGVFTKFTSPEELTKKRAEEEEQPYLDPATVAAEAAEKQKADLLAQAQENTEEDSSALPGVGGASALSKKQKKKLTRLTVAELKQLVARPDVVEMHDANSPDPKLLVTLKAYRNTVPVPRHWCQKSKYLQRKRGIEKLPFQLPQFIEDTGISKLRNAAQAADAAKGLKSKLREKMQPKTGKIDIDYQVLHDAFFVYQTKPFMTHHGQLYYEGKEFEAKMVEKKPGDYSEELMQALGMVHGKASPPPWLFAMQRYGPPPSYPSLKVPGVNAPLPSGCRYGTREGEWGRAPVNEFGQPMWGGDLFSQVAEDNDEPEVVDKTRWGELEKEEEEPEEEEEEVKDEAVSDDDEPGAERKTKAPSGDSKSGIESVSTVDGLETPQSIQLRKRQDGTGTETPDTLRRTAVETGQFYTILEQKEAHVDQNTLFGSAHTYVVPPIGGDKEKKKKAAPGQVELALAPEELEGLDAETLKRKYQQQLETEKAAKAAMRIDHEDTGDDDRTKKKRKTDKRFKF